ncbi:MAG TPA: choice-of-anchor Q domain-containing protein, partial [Pyrinomonadaceae bacterium]|nr:choice-of-anchor Q domain-containing protein [Pyrinomonadaceae bacterium]
MKKAIPLPCATVPVYFLLRVVVSVGLLAAMVFVIARNDSTSRAQGGCTTDPVVANNVDNGAGSLRQAIADACAGSTITFNLATVISPITLTSAELLVNKNLTITGPGSGSLTVQRSTAGGTPDFRIFNINGGVTVSIAGLTLSNGRVSGNFPGNAGGAIWNNHSSLTITDCILSGNSAVQVSPAGFGGALYNDGSNGGSATLTILNSQITGNSAIGSGGGIFNFGFNGTANLSITNSTINNNSAPSGSGGVASSGQGGNAPVQIIQSTLTGNNGQSGGGISMDGTQSGNAPLTVVNSTISGNRAAVIGGGLISQGTTNVSGAPVTIVNTTITNNRCDSDDTSPSFSCGGAYFIFTGPVTIHNTIVARNFNGSTGTTADDVMNNSFNAASSFNLIGTGGAGGLVNGVNNNLVGVANPLLGPLANNGGPTETHRLLAGSPAIEAGTNCVLNNSCSPALGLSLTTDQRGISRAADSADANTTQTVDIGAFEARASVEDIADKSTPEETFLSFSFNVGDQSAITNVSASSSNTTLVPNANLNVFGSGSTRTLNISPVLDQTGTATITVTVTSSTESMSDTFILTVTPVNDTPTDISLSNNNVADNSPGNTLVGTLGTTDPDALQTFSYTLVSGAGSVDNASFSISGDQLRTASTFDFETKPIFTIRVRSTDGEGLFTEKQFTVNVVDGADNPGAIAFTSPGFSVGEGDGNATITLTRTGGTDNAVFAKVNLSDVTTSAADYVFAPGSLDTSFNTGTGASSHSSALPQYVQPVVLQPDGKILIAGAFLFYNDVSRNRVARLNSDGTIDGSFNPGAGPDTDVLCMALQADGKILIGGNFASYDGAPRSRIARLNSNGTLDSSFAAVFPDDVVRSIVVQPDGKILIGGDFSLVNGILRNHVARLNDNGSLDSFVPASGSTGVVSTLALQPDGKIIVGGGFISFSTANNTRVVRLNSNGTLDGTFNSALGISMAPRQVLVQPDGKILVAGEFIGVDTPFGKHGIARLETSGAIDGTFDPGLGTDGHTIQAIALQPDSKIVIVGGFPTFNGTTVNGVARLDSGGSLDTSFNSGTGINVPFPVRGIAIQPDGKIVIGGQYTFYNGVSSNGITRINGDLFVMWAAGDSANK